MIFTFRELNLQPMPMSHLTENITVHDMIIKEAKWHKPCYNKLSVDKLERAKRKIKQANTEALSYSEGSTKCECLRPQPLDKNSCIFCAGTSGKLHQFSTLQSDASLRNMAKEDLQETSLLTKIEGGDLIALEAKYHLLCLATLCNHHRSHTKENNNASSECVKKKKRKQEHLLN